LHFRLENRRKNPPLVSLIAANLELDPIRDLDPEIAIRSMLV
jgi:hypothetical protein